VGGCDAAEKEAGKAQNRGEGSGSSRGGSVASGLEEGRRFCGGE